MAGAGCGGPWVFRVLVRMRFRLSDCAIQDPEASTKPSASSKGRQCSHEEGSQGARDLQFLASLNALAISV